MSRFFRKTVPYIFRASWHKAILIRTLGTCSKQVAVLAGELCLIKAGVCVRCDLVSCLNTARKHGH